MLNITVNIQLGVDFVFTITVHKYFRGWLYIHHYCPQGVWVDADIIYSTIRPTVHWDFGLITCYLLLSTETLGLMLILRTHHYCPQRVWDWCWYYVLTIAVHWDLGLIMYSPLLLVHRDLGLMLILCTHHCRPQWLWGWCWCRWFLLLLCTNGSLQEDDY